MKQNIYRKMYLHLFNQVTEAINALESGEHLNALLTLRKAQFRTEEMYADSGEAGESAELEAQEREDW